ncbi:hypothetical protein [Ramlibacter sp.]|uniref:hypothetical protein n=1 Tax=Ramlibacter sp. TaxID=1917967 RepID=UPI002FC85912
MSDQLLRLKTLQAYGAEREHVFPSKTSLAWFLRRHKPALIQAGALLMITGRWFVDPEKFDDYVISEGRSAAARHDPESGE